MANKLDPIGKSSTGLDENVAALLSILFSPISSIIFLVIEKESKFVKFHSIQSLAVTVVAIVLSAILSITCIGPIIASVLFFVVWIILLIKAFQGEWFELPLVGKFSMDQVNKQK